MESPVKERAFPSAQASGRAVIPCWETMRCGNVTCPAHNGREAACWRLPDACPGNHRLTPGGGRLQSCPICPVFKLNAEADPRGWSHFVAAELVYLIPGAPEDVFPHEAAYFRILMSLPHGVLLADKNDRIHFANPAAEQVTGLPAPDMLGRTCREILDGLGFGAEPISEEHGPRLEVPRVEKMEMSRADGKSVHVAHSVFPFEDPSGAMHVLEDITDRKRLEEDLRRSEENYRRLFEGSKDMIFIHSRGSIFKDLNQACVEMLGYASREELLSIASVERVYVNPIHRRVFQEQIDRYGFVKDFETTFKKKDGAHIHCLVSGTADRDKNGRIIGYETVAKDITARMDGVRNLHQQHRELSLLHSVAVSMNVTHELNEILLVALKKVLEVLSLEAGAVFLINHEKSDFVLQVRQGLPEALVTNGYQLLLKDQALMRFLLQPDASLKPQRTFPPISAVLKGQGDEAPLELLCFLITAKQTASGFIALEVPETRQVTSRDHQMLGSLGNFLGSAIEKTCLLRTIRQHREELKRLTARLFHSQEEERKRIAQELHDEAGQALTGINFTLETLIKDPAPELAHFKENILDVKKQINRTCHEMRRISHRLHPALLSNLGLEPALESCLERISVHSRMSIEFRMVGFEGRLDPEIETVLYRISQEAINNTLKHSGADHFRLCIIKSYPNIIFLAEDDGIGFDPDDFERNKQALGLLCMRERAAMVAGSFSLRTAKGKGTRIRVEIPVKESQYNGQNDHDSLG